MKISRIGKNIKAVVTVEVEGFFVERLINLLKNNGIENLRLNKSNIYRSIYLTNI